MFNLINIEVCIDLAPVLKEIANLVQSGNSNNLRGAYEEGLWDGQHGYPMLNSKLQDQDYVRGFSKGIEEWTAELSRREKENYPNLDA